VSCWGFKVGSRANGIANASHYAILAVCIIVTIILRVT